MTNDPISAWLNRYYNDGTRRQYQQALDDLTAYAGDLLALTPDQAAAWVRDRSGYLAPSTVRSRLAAAREFYRWAQRRKKVDDDPFAEVKPPTGQRLGRGRALRLAEARALWKAARLHSERPERDLALFEVLLRCGLRRAEAAALTWSQVHLAAEPAHLVVRGKRDRERRVKLPPPAAEALGQWRACLNGASAPEVPVFGLTGSGVYKAVVRRVADAGIAHASPHDFRRTFVTRTLDAGAPLERVQEAAGHVKPETTLIYDKARRELENAPGDYLDWEL